MNNYLTLILGAVLMTAPVAAQSQNAGNPGFVSPNSPLYGLEVALDNAAVSVGIKKASKVAEERVAEAESMAAKNNTKGMQKAAEQFGKMAEKSMKKNETGLNSSIQRMEQLIQNAPNEQARAGMEGALENMREARKNRENRESERRNGSPDRSDIPQEQIPTEPQSPQQEEGPEDQEPQLESPSNQEQQNPDSDSNTGSPDTTTTTTSGTGDFDLLVSDAPADISDFEYLNVSFSEARVFSGTSEDDEDSNSTENQTENMTETNSTGNHSDDEIDSNETEGSEGFRTISLNGSTVDLTKVVGTYAQSIANTELEAGTYNKVELYSSEISASVNGSEVDVKIPPGKLMITKPFTVSENETTEFVFDIQVVLRGNERNNQGYILKPVISESGVAGKDVEMTRGQGNSMAEEGEEMDNETSGSQAGGPPANPGSQGNRP